MKRLVAATFTLALLGVSTEGYSQIITDRPDFTESPVSVPRGSIQLEAGLTLESHTEAEIGVDDLTVDDLTVGEALVRWGIFDNLEARFQIPSYRNVSIEGNDGPSIDGFSDLDLGVKYQFSEDDSDLQFGAIVKASLPTGSDDFTSDEVEPEAILIVGKQLGPSLSLAGQIVVGVPSDGDGRSFEWGASIVSAAGWSRVGAFLEYSITVPDEGTASQVIHLGGTFSASDRLQLDLHGGFGVSSTAPDSFIGAGFSAAI